MFAKHIDLPVNPQVKSFRAKEGRGLAKKLVIVIGTAPLCIAFGVPKLARRLFLSCAPLALHRVSFPNTTESPGYKVIPVHKV